MTYPDRDDLDKVNDAVNALPYVADATRYKQPDFWARADGEGSDCEDFALGKLKRLHDLGWPIAALRLACCYVEPAILPPDNYHAVLAVDLGDNQVVLDNRFNHVVSLDELQRIGYRPDIIQRKGGSHKWANWEWQQSQ